jgi:hypothetical protein
MKAKIQKVIRTFLERSLERQLAVPKTARSVILILRFLLASSGGQARLVV